MAQKALKKEDGGHNYGDPVPIGFCHFGCGCKMQTAKNGGPVNAPDGTDALGTCPKNPKNGTPATLPARRVP